MEHQNVPSRILLCEDERIVALSEKSVLERAGYAVDIAESGEQALEMLAAAGDQSSRLPSLILMDIDLGPGLDGTETAERIIASYDIPLVFLSSHTEPEIVEKTEGITSYGYVVKNTGDTVLLASIRMAFRLFEAKQQQRDMDDQLRAQNQYLKLYRTAVDGMDDHQIAVVDAGYTYRMVSRQFAESYASQEAQIVGRTVTDLVGLDVFADRIQPYIDRGLSGEQLEFHDWFKFPLLGSRYMRVRYYPLPDFDSGCSAVAVVMRDITDRMRAEEQARLAEHNLDLIFNAVPAVIWFTDLEERYIRVNRTWARVKGISPSDAIGKTARDVFTPEVARQLQQEEREIVRTGQPLLGHLQQFQTLSGEDRWSRTDRLPMTDDAGNIIGVVGFAVDVTAERQAIQDLEAARARTDAILAAHPDIVFVTDPDGLILEYHTRATDLLAGTEILGKSVQDQLPGETGSRIGDAIRRAYDTGDLQIIDYELEVPAGHRYFEDRLVRLDDERVLGIVRDITVRKTAELEVRRLLADKENLLREVQHRIKNTMNTMVAMLSLHASAVQGSPAAASALTDARSRFRSMEVLYDQLYRSDTHDRSSLRDYLSQVVQTVVALFPAGDRVAVSFELQDLVLPTSALSPVGMIVTELVTNAMKYAFNAEQFQIDEQPVLSVTSELTPDTVCVTVRDNGPGYPAGSAASAGGGFGLRMVRALAEQIQGTITVDSGRGTSVSVVFPRPSRS